MGSTARGFEANPVACPVTISASQEEEEQEEAQPRLNEEVGIRYTFAQES
jgi:hypothetical protein